MLDVRLRLPSLLRLGMIALAVVAAPLVLRSANAAVIVIGTNDGPANVFPIGTTIYAGEYQQAYTSTAFSGPVTITAIAFASNNTSAGNTITDTFTLGLSTTSASLAGLSTNYASNIGPDSTTVFSGTKTFTSIGDGSFDFLVTLTTPFNYDPSMGNLLLDVNIASNSGSQVSFEATSDPVTSRVYNSGGTGTPTHDINYGLVTAFTVGPLAAVPEPSTYALGATFAAGVFLLRRRRFTKSA
jgi:hypothetical protein